MCEVLAVARVYDDSFMWLCVSVAVWLLVRRDVLGIYWKVMITSGSSL